MRVRIDKAEEPYYWYANQIGSVFNVIESRSKMTMKYYSLDSGTVNLEIKQSDCTVLQEPESEADLGNLRENRTFFTKEIRTLFDLDKAKTHQVVTKDGWKVRILDADFKSEQSLVTIVENPDGTESIETYTSSGRYISQKETGMDLVLVPKQASKWVNEYRSVEFDTKEIAFSRNENLFLETLQLNYLGTKEIKTDE